MLSAQMRADESMLADGEGVWSWPPDAGVKSEGDESSGDGGNQSPVSEESTL